MLTKRILSLGVRFISTSVCRRSNNLAEKAVQTQLLKVCGEEGHKLQGVAQEIVRLQDDAKDILELTGEAEKDKELQAMARKDLAALEEQIGVLRRQFLNELVDSYRFDPVYASCKEILLEVTPGVGGQEAMLFSKDLLALYSNYAEYKGWDLEVMHYDGNDLGGVRHGSLLISSPEAYKLLLLESGVHRVQRIPKTERAGRIHTSTSAVSILPTLDDLSMKIEDKDLRIETKKASGAGGQHVNTTESAVRITHIPTGISVDCQKERSQIRNRTLGLKMLMNKLYQLEHEKQVKMSKDLKKMQIGLAERSDKIRTYNFLQDRITDHRYSFTTHNVHGFLEGGEIFDEFLHALRTKEVDRVLNLL